MNQFTQREMLVTLNIRLDDKEDSSGSAWLTARILLKLGAYIKNIRIVLMLKRSARRGCQKVPKMGNLSGCSLLRTLARMLSLGSPKLLRGSLKNKSRNATFDSHRRDN